MIRGSWSRCSQFGSWLWASSSSRCSSASTTIVRNLTSRKRSPPLPIALLAEEDRAARVELDRRSRSATSSGAAGAAAAAGADRRPCARLSARDERDSTGGLMPSTVTPSTSSTSTDGPSASNSCGSTLTLIESCWQRRRTSSSAAVAELVRRRRRARRRARATTLDRSRRALAQRRTAATARPSDGRERCDQPDGLEAVLGVRAHLAHQRRAICAPSPTSSTRSGPSSRRATPAARAPRSERSARQRDRGEGAERRRRRCWSARRARGSRPSSSEAADRRTAWKSHGRSSSVVWLIALDVAVVEPVAP